MKRKLAIAIDVAVVLTCFVFALWLMFSTLGYKDGQIIIASKVWSDFGAHIPLIRSFSWGDNIPPEYPHFAGEPITYHFLFYWLTAQLENIGLNIAFSFNLLSSLGFGLLLSLIYYVAKKIFMSAVAGIIAILLVLFNGSLTFWFYFNQQGWSVESLKQIPQLTKFVQFGPWNGDAISAFWQLNIYTNQRHLGLAFAVMLIFLWPLVQLPRSSQSKTKSRPNLTQPKKLYLYLAKKCRQCYLAVKTTKADSLNINAWLLLAPFAVISPLLHQGIVPFACIIVFWWAVFHPQRLLQLAVFYGGLLLLSLPGFVYLSQGDSYTPTYLLGFLSPAKDGLSIVTYWFLNTGIYLPLACVVFFWGSRSVKALISASLTFFIIANLVQLTPDIINNHKLINWSLLLLSITFGGFLTALLKKNLFFKILGISLFISLTFSGFIDLFPILNDHPYHINDAPKSDTITWITTHTPKNAVFLSADKFYNPASIAGRKLWFGYSYFPWSMGYNTGPREDLSRHLFSTSINPSSLCHLLIQHQIDYIILSRGKGEIGDTDVQLSTINNQFEPEFISSTEAQVIYSVASNCQ